MKTQHPNTTGKDQNFNFISNELEQEFDTVLLSLDDVIIRD